MRGRLPFLSKPRLRLRVRTGDWFIVAVPLDNIMDRYLFGPHPTAAAAMRDSIARTLYG